MNSKAVFKLQLDSSLTLLYFQTYYSKKPAFCQIDKNLVMLAKRNCLNVETEISSD